MKIIFLFLTFSFARSITWENKLSPGLINSLKPNRKVNIFVSFENTSTLLAKISFQITTMNHGDKSVAIVEALKQHATTSQSSLLGLLSTKKQFDSKFRSFWITNQVYIENTDTELISELAKVDEVKAIEEEIIIKLDSTITRNKKPYNTESWGTKKIQVEEAWALLGRGESAVVGIIDSGARFTHEAIRNTYLGSEHSWHDPYGHSDEPNDLDGHGTHVTGTIVGSSGIGIAPGAIWIACKGFNPFGSLSALLECGQFMLCPGESSGVTKSCGVVPLLVSNSWGNKAAGLDFYDGVIRAWKAANIISIFAAGNYGPNCESIGSPADSNAGVIAVAASNVYDEISWFSSRGPAPYAAAHKPDVTVPGNEIVSAGIADDQSYVTLSGTSMAAPHVAGLVALLKSHSPHLTFDQIAETLKATADTNVTFAGDNCGDGGEIKFPNFLFGYGRNNAFTAAESLLVGKRY